MGLKIGGQVERVDGTSLTYAQFAATYLRRNEPVVLTGLMDGWRACRDWVTADGKPNLPFFTTHFGNSRVQVADCRSKEFTDQKRVEMSVAEFVSYWIDYSNQDCSKDNCMKDRPVLYLKDWHFVKEYDHYNAYSTPSFFLDDWLNLYHDTDPVRNYSKVEFHNDKISCSDYRFVYMGPKGSWTPLHADVFRSYSWSANVCGKKNWFLLSPSQSHLIFDRCGPLTHVFDFLLRDMNKDLGRSMKNSVYDILSDVSETYFPGFKKAVWLECAQGENEIIFVPSGWYHQVHNMEDTISINHNWFNAYSLSFVWNLLLRDYHEAVGYIEDIRGVCDDFEGLCQRNLLANSGMNFLDFFFFIMRISVANLILLHYLVRDGESQLSVSQYLLANLASLRQVASSMIEAYALTGANLKSLWAHSPYAISYSRSMLEEKEFTDLCIGISKAYGVVNMHMKMMKLSSGDIETLVSDLSKKDAWNVESLAAFERKLLGPEALISFINSALKDLTEIANDQISLLINQMVDV